MTKMLKAAMGDGVSQVGLINVDFTEHAVAVLARELEEKLAGGGEILVLEQVFIRRKVDGTSLIMRFA
jgi:hypothetical protein